METRKRKEHNNIKVLHGGYTFTSIDSFLKGILPTKRDVIQRVLHFPHFRTVETANAVAKELVGRWLWCNVYPMHQLTVSQKIQDMVTAFSTLDRWSKATRKSSSFSKKVDGFLSDIDKLFDIYCSNQKQRRLLEQGHQLRMTNDDLKFYEDQKSTRIAKCLDDVVPLGESDEMYNRRLESTSSTIDQPSSSADGYFSDTDSISTATSLQSEFIPTDQERGQGNQNRKKWPNLARISERFQLSDRAAAAVANSALQDVGLITKEDQSHVIDRSKLRRERQRWREELQRHEEENLNLVDAIYLDGRKDATLVMLEWPNGQLYRSAQLEEHVCVVGEPGEYYLTHLSPSDGKGRTIAKEIYNSFRGTELHKKMAIVGTDGTASMTGRHNGCIRALEQLLNRPLQWVICLLHANELPLRHVFMELDGTTRSPDSFSGPIGKILGGSVSEWPVVAFQNIPNASYPELDQDVVEDLSSDQHYAYRISMAIMLGTVDEDLTFLEIGPIVHSRWLTLACRILRYYASNNNPSKNLITLAKFCIYVYFPSWFEIKSRNKITDGPRNFFNILQRIVKFPNQKVKDVSLGVIQRNAFFAHPENVILGMLADEDEDLRRLAVNKVQSLRGNLPTYNIDNFDESFESANDDHGGSGEEDSSSTTTPIRMFVLPSLNLKAKSYHKMVDLNAPEIQEPPALRNMNDSLIELFRTTPLKMDHPCHNQSVERHIKIVTEASAHVTGFERRDGVIRQKIKSRKLMKIFDTKKQFPTEEI